MELSCLTWTICGILAFCIISMLVIGYCCYAKHIVWRRTNYDLIGETAPEPLYQKERLNMISEIRSLKKQVQEERSEKDALKKEVQEERSEKEKALTRLSSIASSRVRDGNPNVVDLSDQNRPGKLGEQYSELYDNEWTDAYAAIVDLKRFSSTQTINILLQILLKCFEMCKAGAEQQLEGIRKELSTIISLVAKDSKTAVDDMLYRVKEERKLYASKQTPDIQTVKQMLITADIVDAGVLNIEPVRLFTQSCTRLCWLMVVQDPPMALLVKTGGNADQCYRAYMTRGKHIMYLVWPTLLLHKDGALVFKGIAEFGNI